MASPSYSSSSSHTTLDSNFFNWECLMCGEVADGQSDMTTQQLWEEVKIIDRNGTPWVRCDLCANTYHFCCAGFLYEDEFIEGRFICNASHQCSKFNHYICLLACLGVW